MMRATASLAAVLLTASVAPAQSLQEIHSHPTPPPTYVLNRLNLAVSWRATVPVTGVRDGLYGVHVQDRQLLVQTRAGMVLAYDHETGALLWQALVGAPYQTSQQLGFNAHTIFAARGGNVFAIDRATGRVHYKIPAPGPLVAPPAADAERLYLTVTNRLHAYEFPKIGLTAPNADKKPVAEGEKKDAPATSQPPKPTPGIGPRVGNSLVVTARPPVVAWDYPAFARLEHPPVVAALIVFMVDSSGTFFALPANYERKELYRLPITHPAPVEAGQLGEAAYVATQDFMLHAIDIGSSRLYWRWIGGSSITRAPAVTEEDVYVTCAERGMYRLDRATGREHWAAPAPGADRFLAANAKFVYAMDRSNRLLVLDRQRGTILSWCEAQEFRVPVRNERTDRVFLAGNDGTLLCLHDRDYPTPLRMRQLEEEFRIPGRAKLGRKDEKKEGEPEKKEGEMEKKDDAKDKEKMEEKKE